MNPAQHTRVVLAEYKQLGVAFDIAWASAMRTLPRGSVTDGTRTEYREWKRALNWARPAYHAVYENSHWDIIEVDLEHTVLVATEAERVPLAA